MDATREALPVAWHAPTDSPCWRQLFLPVVLPHLRMLPAVLRMIVPAVSGESGAGGAPGWEMAARWFTLDREEPRSGRRVSGGCAAPAGRPPRDALPAAPVRPPATCRGVAGADRSGCSRGRYVTVRNRLVGVDGTERKARYQERRKAGGSRSRRPADGRVKSDHGGTVGRLSAESRSDIRPRVPWRDQSPGGPHWSGARRGTRRAAGLGRHWRSSRSSVTTAPRSPGLPSPSRSLLRTRHQPTVSSPTVDADSNRLPSGAPSGIRRSAASRGILDGRDAPVQAGPQGP